MAEIKPMSEWFIRPNSELVERLKTQLPRYHYLSPLDLVPLSMDYMQQGLIFTKPPSSSSLTSNPLSNFLKLRLTLSLALVHFYPLAGRLETDKYEDEHACCVFIDCNKGPGARLIHAVAPNISIMDIVAPNVDVPNLLVHSFFDFGERAKNHDGHTRPLLSIQVTDLVDGVFMGISMNHCVGDGTTFLHFLQVWSKIFMKLSDGEDHINQLVSMPLSLPSIERPSILDGYGPTIKLPYLEPDEFIKRRKEPLLRDRVFHFSASTMAMLKAKANAECNDSNITISSFQALSALVWRSITRARNLPLGEITACSFPTNIRPQFEPPLTNNYLGNYVGTIIGAAKVGELLGHNLGWVAKLLYQARLAADDKIARDDFMRPFLEGYSSMAKQWMAIPVGPKHVHINGSARFDVYGLEYGLGRPVAARHG